MLQRWKSDEVKFLAPRHVVKSSSVYAAHVPSTGADGSSRNANIDLPRTAIVQHIVPGEGELHDLHVRQIRRHRFDPRGRGCRVEHALQVQHVDITDRGLAEVRPVYGTIVTDRVRAR
jgi:hypothetical protein